MKRLALIGGGGFAKEVLEVAELCGYTVVGCVDDAVPVRAPLPHWGGLGILARYRAKFDQVALAVGAVDRRSFETRARIVAMLEQQGLTFAKLVSPAATIAKGVQVDPGVFVAHGVVVSVDAQLGRHVILNSNAIVGHDAVIGDQSIVAPGAFIGGGVRLGQRVLVGPGAQVIQGVSVGAQTIISVGTVVLRSLPPASTTVPQRYRILPGKT
jgi:acetyltransferase EpsM